jgi:uncharacterized DUF497 family protein
MQFSGIDWDAGNRVKCTTHGVSLEEIEALFMGPCRFSPDVMHSVAEQRLIAVGRTVAGRALFVAFTVRERDGLVLARPVSARYMHAGEALRYDRQTAH